MIDGETVVGVGNVDSSGLYIDPQVCYSDLAKVPSL
jgi:hypothetical protein